MPPGLPQPQNDGCNARARLIWSDAKHSSLRWFNWVLEIAREDCASHEKGAEAPARPRVSDAARRIASLLRRATLVPGNRRPPRRTERNAAPRRLRPKMAESAAAVFAGNCHSAPMNVRDLRSGRGSTYRGWRSPIGARRSGCVAVDQCRGSAGGLPPAGRVGPARTASTRYRPS